MLLQQSTRCWMTRKILPECTVTLWRLPDPSSVGKRKATTFLISTTRFCQSRRTWYHENNTIYPLFCIEGFYLCEITSQGVNACPANRTHCRPTTSRCAP